MISTTETSSSAPAIKRLHQTALNPSIETFSHSSWLPQLSLNVKRRTRKVQLWTSSLKLQTANEKLEAGLKIAIINYHKFREQNNALANWIILLSLRGSRWIRQEGKQAENKKVFLIWWPEKKKNLNLDEISTKFPLKILNNSSDVLNVMNGKNFFDVSSATDFQVFVKLEMNENR